jgi:hypothetical protein
MLWRDAVLAGRQELRGAFTFQVPLPGRLDAQPPCSRLAWSTDSTERRALMRLQNH